MEATMSQQTTFTAEEIETMLDLVERDRYARGATNLRRLERLRDRLKGYDTSTYQGPG
jgi:ribosomal 50S subunit-associated protein YjgA (DUF615 family)